MEEDTLGREVHDEKGWQPHVWELPIVAGDMLYCNM